MISYSMHVSLPESMKIFEVNETLDNPVKQRSQLSDKHPDLTRLDGSINPLTLILCSMYPQGDALSAGPYQLGHEDSPPASRTPISSASSLLQDLREADLINELSAILEVAYLSAANIRQYLARRRCAVWAMQAPDRMPAHPAPRQSAHERLLPGGHRCSCHGAEPTRLHGARL